MLESPQFQFRHLVLDMELIIFTLIHSFRKGDLILYREALSGLIPYLFANKSVSFACWLASSLPRRYIPWPATPRSSQGVSQRKLCCPQVQKEVLCHSHWPSPWTKQCGYQRWWSGSWVNRVQRSTSEMDSSWPWNEPPNWWIWGHVWCERCSHQQQASGAVLAELVGTHQQRGQEQFQSFKEGMGIEGESTFYKSIKGNTVAFFKLKQAASSSKEKVLKDLPVVLTTVYLLSDQTVWLSRIRPASLSDSGKRVWHTCQKSLRFFKYMWLWQTRSHRFQP